jgi:hypothetical protein
VPGAKRKPDAIDHRIHAAIEEELFYPAVCQVIDDDPEARADAPDDPRYAATFTAPGECVKHRLEEEEGEMSPGCGSA